MASPLISFLTGLGSRRVVETVVPARTLSEVVLPPQTRRTLDQALAEVRNHNLIFTRWGLGERHTSGRGLAFNFAGPPGTGKTICADAIATRRSIGAGSAPDRERNLTVNVLLRELETFNGIVIFATNLAANFDRG